jgi:hypothetical protein
MIDFNNIFNSFKPTSSFINSARYQDGYVKNSFDTLLNKATRIEAVKKSKIMDYNYLVNDPNFSRKKSQEQLDKLMGQMIASNQLVQTVKTQFMVLRIHEYLPQSMQDFLINYQSFMDTNINFMSLFKQDLSFKKLAGAMASDLISQYTSGNLYLDKFLQISTRITDYFVFSPPSKNNAIRELLSLGILDLLPFDTKQIFVTLDYISLVQTLFNDPIVIDNFTAKFENFIDSFSSKKVNTKVNTSSYNDVSITTEDPYGLEINSSLNQSIINSFSTELTQFLEDNVDGDYSELHELILNDFQQNLDQGLKSTGLPTIAQSVKSIENDVFNKIGDSFKQAMDDVANHIIQDLRVVNRDETPVDYLYNLRRNIKVRKSILSQGASTIDREDNIKYFEQILGKQYSDSEFDRIAAKMDTLNG